MVLLANFAVFGMTVTVFGATVPRVIHDFGWGYIATGLVVSASPIGYFVSAFASGLLVERFGAKAVILGGLMAQAAGLAFFGSVPRVIPNLSMALGVGVGQGVTEVVTNLCVARMDRSGRSRLMSLMHGGFTLGAVMSPVLVGWAIAAGRTWQGVYQAMAVLSLIMMGGIFLFSFDPVEPEQSQSGRPPFGWLVRQPLLGLFFTAMLLFTGAELGLSSWVSQYCVKVLDLSAATGAWMVSVFWLGVLCGRIGVSALYGGPRQIDLVLVFGCSSTAVLAAFLLGSAREAPILLFATGVGYSAIYPALVASAGHNYKHVQAEAIGTVVTGGGMGSFLFPIMIGGIAGRWGIAAGIWFCCAATGAGVLVAWALRMAAGKTDVGVPQAR